ncbi:MAG: SCO family protein, partial [Pseudomonadota bacterium]
GDASALQTAYDAFSVEVEPLFQDPEYGWIYAHGSFVHLLDGTGEMLTLLPPILDAERTTEIVRGYLAPRG